MVLVVHTREFSSFTSEVNRCDEAAESMNAITGRCSDELVARTAGDHPQPERTRDDQVGAVEAGVEVDAALTEADADAERIVVLAVEEQFVVERLARVTLVLGRRRELGVESLSLHLHTFGLGRK